MVWKRKKKDEPVVEEKPTKIISTARDTVDDSPPELPEPNESFQTSTDNVIEDLMRKVKEREEQIKKEAEEEEAVQTKTKEEDIEASPELQYGIDIFNREYGMITLDNIDTKLLFAIFTELRILRGEIARNKKED